MLRLSKKTDYALMAMTHLASQLEDGSASAREIAAEYGIPVELLAKVLQRLARRGLLTSQQGLHGGYQLSRPAAAISVADVIDAIDGPLVLTACSESDDDCDQYARCSVRDPLWRLRGRIVAALSGCTIAEMASDRTGGDAPVFSIGDPVREAAR